MVYPVLEFMKEKQTFANVEGGNMDFNPLGFAFEPSSLADLARIQLRARSKNRPKNRSWNCLGI
jgi:hypothetical protein